MKEFAQLLIVCLAVLVSMPLGVLFKTSLNTSSDFGVFMFVIPFVGYLAAIAGFIIGLANILNHIL